MARFVPGAKALFIVLAGADAAKAQFVEGSGAASVARSLGATAAPTVPAPVSGSAASTSRGTADRNPARRPTPIDILLPDTAGDLPFVAPRR